MALPYYLVALLIALLVLSILSLFLAARRRRSAMTPAMATAGVSDGQAAAYVPTEESASASELDWSPVAPTMPAVTPPMDSASQSAAQVLDAPSPLKQAAEPAPPQIITAGGRIQVHCPACGAGNAVANRTCILCAKKLPPVS